MSLEELKVLHQDLNSYIMQMAPHQKERVAGKLLARCMSAVESHIQSEEELKNQSIERDLLS